MDSFLKTKENIPVKLVQTQDLNSLRLFIPKYFSFASNEQSEDQGMTAQCISNDRHESLSLLLSRHFTIPAAAAASNQFFLPFCLFNPWNGLDSKSQKLGTSAWLGRVYETGNSKMHKID